MITKYIKHFLLVGAVSVLCPSIQATTIPVVVRYKAPPIVNGSSKPTKAPAYYNCPLYVSIESDNNLVFDSSEVNDVTFYIYDSSDNLMMQESYVGDNYSVNLNGLTAGEYRIEVVCNDVTYEGVFELEYDD